MWVGPDFRRGKKSRAQTPLSRVWVRDKEGSGQPNDKTAAKEKRVSRSTSKRQHNRTMELMEIGLISVSVDDSETWVEAKRYTVYKVVVRTTDKAYFVFRR